MKFSSSRFLRAARSPPWRDCRTKSVVQQTPPLPFFVIPNQPLYTILLRYTTSAMQILQQKTIYQKADNHGFTSSILPSSDSLDSGEEVPMRPLPRLPG